MFQTTITYDTASNFYFDPTLVQVSAGAISLLSPYSLLNPLVRTQNQLQVTSLSGFTEVSTKPSNTQITYLMYLNSVPYWYNAADFQWEVSDGTFAKSSSASVIATNASTLIPQSFLQPPVFLSVGVLLTTTDGVSTPVLTSNSLTYQFTTAAANTISKCVLSVNLQTLLGALPTYNVLYPSQFKVSSDRPFIHSGNMILPFTQTATFDSTGYAQLTVIETATPGKKLSASVTYYDGTSLRQIKMYPTIVPNQPTCLLTSLSDAWNYDFG